jgi:basic membrane protein A
MKKKGKSRSTNLVVRLCLVAVVALVVTVAAASAATSAPAAKSADRIKAAILYQSAATVGSYNTTHNAAFNAMCQKYDFDCQTIDHLPPAQTADAMRALASQGVKIIIASSNGYADQLLQVAPQFRDTWFVMTSDLPTTNGLRNVAAFEWDWYQFGWLGGLTAGYLSKTGRMGYVLGAPLLAAGQAMEGFLQGARLSNKKAKLTFRNINSFSDPVAAREAAQAMISSGVDVLTGIAGGANLGIIQAAEAAKAKYIGYLADEYKTAPGTIPTSMMGNVAREYDQLGKLYTKHQLQPKIYVGTLKNAGISLAPLRGVPTPVKKKILAAVARLKAGKLKINEKGLFPIQ